MKLGVLYSGGKDSTYAALLAKNAGHELVCLISMASANPYSFMFHTPSISQVKKQAERMSLPILITKTEGEKEKELGDLERAIAEAKKEYAIEGVVTGALHSVYQAERIQAICDRLGLQCVNPLWHKDQFELLRELIVHKFTVIIVAVAAEPLDESWLGRTIDELFIRDVEKVKSKTGIHVAGEGGEFETIVLDCPLFSSSLNVMDKRTVSDGNNHRLEVVLG